MYTGCSFSNFQLQLTAETNRTVSIAVHLPMRAYACTTCIINSAVYFYSRSYWSYLVSWCGWLRLYTVSPMVSGSYNPWLFINYCIWFECKHTYSLTHIQISLGRDPYEMMMEFVYLMSPTPPRGNDTRYLVVRSLFLQAQNGRQSWNGSCVFGDW